VLKFNVCGERHRAFAETVHLVIRTVTHFNSNLKYIIKMDLLDYALGGVLSQYNKNSELYPVAFLS